MTTSNAANQRDTLGRRRPLAAAATLTALVAFGAGCSASQQDSSSTTSTPASAYSYAVPTDTTSRIPAPTAPPPPVTTPSALPSAYASVDRQNPDAVAQAVVSIWWGWDTTRDTSPYDATVRATPLLTPYLAQSISQFPPVSGPGADWLALTSASAKAHVTTQIAPPEAGTPADSPTSAVRYVAATQSFDAAHPVPDRRLIVVVSLENVPGTGWVAGQVTQR